MNHEVIKLSDLLFSLENRFGVDAHKIHMLRLAEQKWNAHKSLCVTELLDLYEHTSRATTHKAIKELIASKLLQEQRSTEDARVVYLTPGIKFDKYAAAVKGK